MHVGCERRRRHGSDAARSSVDFPKIDSVTLRCVGYFVLTRVGVHAGSRRSIVKKAVRKLVAETFRKQA